MSSPWRMLLLILSLTGHLLARPPSLEPTSLQSSTLAPGAVIAGQPVSPSDVIQARIVTWDEILALENRAVAAESDPQFARRDPAVTDADPRLRNNPKESTNRTASDPGPPLGTSPNLGMQFPGMNLPTSRVNPPDTMGAIGPRHFVELINGSFAIYDKDTGRRMRRVGACSFFAIVNGFKFDPRIMFDPDSRRWIAVAARSTIDPENAYGIILAVSLTDDPFDDWFQVFFYEPNWLGALHDFPTLGTGPNGIYVESNVFPPAGIRVFWAFEKAPLVASPPRVGAVTQWNYDVLDPRLVPVQSYGPNGADVAVAVPNFGGALHVYFIEGPPDRPSFLYQGSLPAPPAPSVYYIPARGTLTGPGLSASRYSSTAPVYRNRTVWIALRVEIANRSAVHWMRVNPYASPPQLLDSGDITHPTLHLTVPSIAVNDVNDVAFGFSASDHRTFTGAYFSGRRGTDALGTHGPILPLKSGEAAVGVSNEINRRWGDYSATTIDPDDDRTFWTLQQYAGYQGQPNTWGLWIGHLAFGGFDCNHNGIDDACDLTCDAGGCTIGACGRSSDCQRNSVPDDCEPFDDCDADGERDACEIAAGTAFDCNDNGLPDICEIETDCNENQFLDECEPDCNANRRPDECDIATGLSRDCNENQLPDECEFAANALIASRPLTGQSLWRSKHNVIRLTFSCDPPQPVPGRDLLISEFFDDKTFGPDLSYGFSFRLEGRGVVRIEDREGLLQHGSRYIILNPAWPGIQYFSVQFPVVVGDADADGVVSFDDLELIHAAVPALTPDDQDRRDINGDNRILYSDLSTAALHVPPDPFPQPPAP